MAKSTTKAPRKLQCLLTAHRNGRWGKKHKGRQHFLGTEYEKAVERFHREWPFIARGIEPPPMGSESDGEDLLQLESQKTISAQEQEGRWSCLNRG